MRMLSSDSLDLRFLLPLPLPLFVTVMALAAADVTLSMGMSSHIAFSDIVPMTTGCPPFRLFPFSVLVDDMFCFFWMTKMFSGARKQQLRTIAIYVEQSIVVRFGCHDNEGCGCVRVREG